MNRFKPRHILLYFIILALVLLSCDNRNIIEPRFYDADNVDDWAVIAEGGGLYFDLINSCDVDAYLLGSAGEIIEVFHENELLGPGHHNIEFDWMDDNGNRYPDGIYCFYFSACDLMEFNWFEYNDPGDNQP